MTEWDEIGADSRELTVEEISDVLGVDESDDFIHVMGQVQNIIDNPHEHVGANALRLAAQLSAFRTKFGIRAQVYKTTPKKTIVNRRRKDLLLTMYSSLEENINTLKLLGKIEAGR